MSLDKLRDLLVLIKIFYIPCDVESEFISIEHIG
jgi:hypothetical protein